MNLKSTLLALMLVIPVSVFSADHYVTVNGAGDKNGSNWDNAMSFTDFCGKIGEYNGDTFKFGIGTYKPAATINITKGIRLEGGYDPTTGEMSATDRTVFSGDKNSNSVADDGDLSCIINVKNVADVTVVIRGMDFTSVYYNGANRDAEYGALYIELCNKVTVGGCKFYGNVAAKEGGVAVRSKTSVARFFDCSFYNNKANSHGAAVRMNSGKVNVGSVVFERCLFTDNNVNEATGSAICVQHCKSLYIINSLIANNSAKSGGAVFVNGQNSKYDNNLVVVSSTIAGNGSNQIFFNQNLGNLRIVNSIVVDAGDGGNTETAAIAGAKEATAKSGGYNLLGTCLNGFVAAESDICGITGDKYNEYFADVNFVNGIKNGKIPNGASKTELKEAVVDWAIDRNVGLEVDVNNTRRGLTVPGAVKADALTGTLKVGKDKVATYYNNVYGYTMPEGLTGYTVTSSSGKYVTTTEAYAAKTNVPRGAALILAGDEKEYPVAFKLAGTKEEENLLHGTQNAELVTAKDNELLYKLANDGGLGFFWWANDGKTLNNGANKCYLVLDKTVAAGAKGFYLSDAITGISSVEADGVVADDAYYTLSGIRVAKPKNGIYIKNGKKVIVK